jgi:hypothetical protein
MGLRFSRGYAIVNQGGYYLHQRGRYTDAEPLSQRALAIREKALGPEHPDVAMYLEDYLLLLRAMDRSQEAEPLEAHARAIRAKSA